MTKEQLKIMEKHAEALKAEGILSGSSKYINPIRKLKDKHQTSPREGWEESFKLMNQNTEDTILIDDVLKDENFEE